MAETDDITRIHDIILQQYPGSIIFTEPPWGSSHWGLLVHPLCTDHEIRDDIVQEITDIEFQSVPVIGWLVQDWIGDGKYVQEEGLLHVQVWDHMRWQQEFRTSHNH